MDGWPTPLRLSTKGAAFRGLNMEANDQRRHADVEDDDDTSADEAGEEDDGF